MPFKHYQDSPPEWTDEEDRKECVRCGDITDDFGMYKDIYVCKDCLKKEIEEIEEELFALEESGETNTERYAFLTIQLKAL